MTTTTKTQTTPTKTTPSPSLAQVLKTPVLFARHFIKITDKQMRDVPLIYNPMQERYLRERTPYDLILKPRQIGFSTAIQVELLRYAITRRAYTLTLMDKADNTKEMRRRALGYYNSIPSPFLYDGAQIVKPSRRTDNDIEAEYANGSVAVMGTAGATNAGRSRTFSHIHLSEVAFYVDAQAIVKSALQAGSPRWVVAESTANGASGWFFDRVQEARQGRGVWKLHFYRWFEFAEYQTPLHEGETLNLTDIEQALQAKYNLTLSQIKWRRAKISEIGTLDDFLQEYPEDIDLAFKKSGTGYFGEVGHVFDAPFDVAFDPSHVYVAGLDFGQHDHTALVVIDATTLTQVDLMRINHQSWADIRRAVIDRLKRWNVQLCIAEKNSIGAPLIEAIITEAYNDGCMTDIRAFDMTTGSKPLLMANYRTGLHEAGLRLLPIDAMKAELNSAVAKETQRGWSVESPRDKDGGHGDTVIAGALAWRAVGLASVDFTVIRI